MTFRTDSESMPSNVDLEQWRREIDVFAAATTSALDAIVNELSNACSGDEGSAVPPKQSSLARHVPVAKRANNESAVKRANASPSPINKGTSTSNRDSRLAAIKEKLASRTKKD